MMKLYLKYFIIAGLIFASTSCKDEFLDVIPADQPTLDGFYKNESQILAATASLYGRSWFEYNDKFSWVAGDGMAGDLYNDYQDEGQMFFFSFTDNNTIISQAWRGLYNTIAYSNAVINDMPPIASSNGVDESAVNNGIAEGRFMRGFAYYLLAEYWEEIPIVENTADLVNTGQIDIPKIVKSDTYRFIIEDLEFAVDNLYSSPEPGRASSWSAKGLLAKVYLTKAQMTGDAADFDMAKTLAQDVILNSGATLMEDYSDLFRIENNNNPESLFALQWINGAWGTGNSRQAVFARSSQITNNSEAWGGGKSATYSFTQALEANAEGKEDLRRPAIYMTLNDYYPEIRKSDGGYTYLFNNNTPEGVNLEYAAPLLNNIKKYIVGSEEDVGVTVNNQAIPLNQYMLRLADVYLIYAEAVIGNSNSTMDGTALSYFNAVRERAGLDPRTEITFMDVFNERRIEFGMEGINWLDVKRFSYRDQAAALTYLNGQERAKTYQRIDGPAGEGLENSWDGYELMDPATPVVINASDLVLPIPGGEVSRNAMLSPAETAVNYF